MPPPQDRPTLHVPARDIPIPSTISVEAQEIIAAQSQLPGLHPYPAPGDAAAWRTHRKSVQEAMLPGAQRRVAGVVVDVREMKVGAAPVYVVTPAALTAEDGRGIYLDVHGGALVVGDGENCRLWAINFADQIGARIWSVDYRMPPDHPYPAALDDCLAAYRTLLEHYDPRQIVVGGVSAGSNLAAALVLRARDEGLPLPAGAVLISPELDLTEAGDSFKTNEGVDTVLRRGLMPANLVYAGGHDLSDPYLSPLLGDFTKGFPPTLLTTGTRDLFLSNAARMHRSLRKADIAAELHVFEAQSHGNYQGTPEGEDLIREVRRFVRERWQEA